MFHLSVPVTRIEECLRFYEVCFGARIERLGGAAANLFVFGGQLTLHDRPDSGLSEEGRREIHFGCIRRGRTEERSRLLPRRLPVSAWRRTG
jgi:extradiol dioxygenase family protein